MAEKKTNEIIEEQRRARQEFLDLKKMQQGEMEAPPNRARSRLFLKPRRKNGIISGSSTNGTL